MFPDQQATDYNSHTIAAEKKVFFLQSGDRTEAALCAQVTSDI